MTQTDLLRLYEDALQRFLPFDMRVDPSKLHGGDREHQLAVINARNVLEQGRKLKGDL